MRVCIGGRGRLLGSADAPYPGLIALDGNLTEELLGQIAQSPAFAAADLRIAPASPGKAERLLPLLRAPRATLYVNLEEAGLICAETFEDSAAAARAMQKRGAARVLVSGPCEGADVTCVMGATLGRGGRY